MHLPRSIRMWLAALPVLVLALAVATPLRAEPATWVFDKEHTNVTVSWNHLGLSRQQARVLDIDGTLTFDPQAPEAASVAVLMQAASLWTGVGALDRQLRGPDFFDAARHPAIAFTSTAVRKTGDRTGEVTGNLTLLGLTRPVTLQVTWNFTGEHPLSAINANYRDRFVSGFSAKGRLLRSEWGLTRGTPLISDEIEVSIEAELDRR